MLDTSHLNIHIHQMWGGVISAWNLRYVECRIETLLIFICSVARGSQSIRPGTRLRLPAVAMRSVRSDSTPLHSLSVCRNALSVVELIGKYLSTVHTTMHRCRKRLHWRHAGHKRTPKPTDGRKRELVTNPWMASVWCHSWKIDKSGLMLIDQVILPGRWAQESNESSDSDRPQWRVVLSGFFFIRYAFSQGLWTLRQSIPWSTTPVSDHRKLYQAWLFYGSKLSWGMGW